MSIRTVAARCLMLAASLAGATPAAAGDPAGGEILAALAAEAKSRDAAFAGFSAERGGVLYAARHGGGKPDTPSCTSCHSPSPRSPGKTRASKDIAPMAVSASPERYTDPRKVAKWFRRNCKSVLGRQCTALEKGDFITFMLEQ